MPADPVVSPADTIRRTLEWAVEHCEDCDQLAECAFHERSFDALDALLAVGERDKAERLEDGHTAREWKQRAFSERRERERVRKLRERDRRHIAQLTEALERIAAWEVSPDYFERGTAINMQGIARAVLADEEDART